MSAKFGKIVLQKTRDIDQNINKYCQFGPQE